MTKQDYIKHRSWGTAPCILRRGVRPCDVIINHLFTWLQGSKLN